MIIALRFLSFHNCRENLFNVTAIRQTILSILSNFGSIDIEIAASVFPLLSLGICSRFKESIIRDSYDSYLTQKWRFCSRDFLLPLQRIYFLRTFIRRQTENVGVPIDYVTARGCYGQGHFPICAYVTFHTQSGGPQSKIRARLAATTVRAPTLFFFVVPLFPTVSWDNDDLWWKPLPSRGLQRRIKAQCARYVALG